jgi:hypothetical protein
MECWTQGWIPGFQRGAKIVMTTPTFLHSFGAGLHSDGGGARLGLISCDCKH